MWVCLGEEENEFVLPANGDHPLKGKLVLVGGAVVPTQHRDAYTFPYSGGSWRNFVSSWLSLLNAGKSARADLLCGPGRKLGNLRARALAPFGPPWADEDNSRHYGYLKGLDCTLT